MFEGRKGEEEMQRSDENGEQQLQLKTPPYPSATRISDSQCYPKYAASLKCLEKINSEKSKCQEHFDVYKECKKKEREARLERNRNRSLFS